MRSHYVIVAFDCQNEDRDSFLISSLRKKYNFSNLLEGPDLFSLCRRSGSRLFIRPTSVRSSVVATITEFVLFSRVTTYINEKDRKKGFDLYIQASNNFDTLSGEICIWLFTGYEKVAKKL